MAILVQKYGGTSVGSLEKIETIAEKIKLLKNQGNDLVIVVSAMSNETNRLLGLASGLSDNPSRRELDVLLSTGEQVTIALLCMALHKRHCAARSYTGSQVRIMTDSAHTKARIQHVGVEGIQADLAKGNVVVVAGFQGCDSDNNITTLGRGGSDTTAVALAAALKADECQIYTDVDGVYTTDPRIVENARKLNHITFDEMLEMASLGSKVLQIRAVEFAGKYNVNLRVLHAFQEGQGTLIKLHEDVDMEAPIISGIAFNREEAKITIKGVPNMPGIAFKILQPISDVNIEVDMIVQNNVDDDTTDFTFTVQSSEYNNALEIVKNTCHELGAKNYYGNAEIAKVSIVGAGIRSHSGIATKMFQALALEGINIQIISTSEIKISVIIEKKYLELAVRVLHETFELKKEPN